MTTGKKNPTHHELIKGLKTDVDSLRKRMTSPGAKTDELILEIESLKDSIHEMHEIFKQALGETKGEEDILVTIKTLNERLQTIVSQNETIARGMVAISDKLEDFMNSQHPGVSRPAAPVRHNMGPPGMPQARAAPPPMAGMQGGMPQAGGAGMSLPPPPPDTKKKSLFG